MVKKAVVLLLLCVYSFSSIGATIHMHYCMNKFAGWSFSKTQKDKCSKCGMVKAGCCKDKKKQVKLSLDQEKATSSNVLQLPFSAPIVFNHAQEFNNPIVNTAKALVYLHGPPLIIHKHPQAFFATFLI
jgi:hypothetical protein